MRRSTTWVLSLAVLVLLAGVTWRSVASRAERVAVAEPPPQEWKPPRVKPDFRVITAANSFGVKVFQTLLAEQSPQNLVISPTSLSCALAMLYSGARGDTYTDIGKTMQLQGLSLGEVDFAYQKLVSSLRMPEYEATVRLANSLWMSDEWPFRPEYVDLCGMFFAADAHRIPFTPSTAVPKMNAWVSENTAGRIQGIVTPEDFEQASGPLALFILDALYFKGKWTTPFDYGADDEFTLLDGKRAQVPLMHLMESFWYHEDESCQFVSLPYGLGRTSMYILLPKDRKATLETCAGLQVQRWEQMIGAMQYRGGTVKLPRFKVEMGRDLNDCLTALGMGSAFDPARADLSGVSPAQLWVDKVRQKTWMQVDEEGTEAAAATMVALAPGCAPPPPPEEPFEMIVDHPFLLAIRDNGTGALLFLGVIMDPRGS